MYDEDASQNSRLEKIGGDEPLALLGIQNSILGDIIENLPEDKSLETYLEELFGKQWRYNGAVGHLLEFARLDQVDVREQDLSIGIVNSTNPQYRILFTKIHNPKDSTTDYNYVFIDKNTGMLVSYDVETKILTIYDPVKKEIVNLTNYSQVIWIPGNVKKLANSHNRKAESIIEGKCKYSGRDYLENGESVLVSDYLRSAQLDEDGNKLLKEKERQENNISQLDSWRKQMEYIFDAYPILKTYLGSVEQTLTEEIRKGGKVDIIKFLERVKTEGKENINLEYVNILSTSGKNYKLAFLSKPYGVKAKYNNSLNETLLAWAGIADEESKSSGLKQCDFTYDTALVFRQEILRWIESNEGVEYTAPEKTKYRGLFHEIANSLGTSNSVILRSLFPSHERDFSDLYSPNYVTPTYVPGR